MKVKKMIKYGLSLAVFFLLQACTAWEDTWDEVIPLPDTNDTVIVEPWELDNTDNQEESGLGT